MPSSARVSDLLLARTSSADNSMPAAAARIAMLVAAHEAKPARNIQPGVTWSPVPPSSHGMSVAICVPLA